MTGVSLSDCVASTEVASRCDVANLEEVLREDSVASAMLQRRPKEEPIRKVQDVLVEGSRPRGRATRLFFNLLFILPHSTQYIPIICDIHLRDVLLSINIFFVLFYSKFHI